MKKIPVPDKPLATARLQSEPTRLERRPPRRRGSAAAGAEPTSEALLQAPRVDGDPPPRRPAAGRLPHAVARRRPRPRRPARVPAPRRRAPHRLERHRAAAAALRAPVHRRPRADRLVPARPVRRASTSAPTDVTKRTRRARVRRRAGAPADAPRQPRRRAALRHRGRHRAAGAQRPPARAAPAAAHGCAARPRPRRGATDLRDLLHRRRSASIKRRCTRLRRLRLHQRAGLGAGARRSSRGATR